MTTSGVTILSPVRDIIIKRALRLVGAYATGGKPRGDQIDDANAALNMMLKAWQIQGFMWLKEFVTVFLSAGQIEYNLPGAKGASSLVGTTLSTDLVALDTIIPVVSSTGMTAGDEIGIYLDDRSIHWDTIATVDTSTQVTITNGVASAASSANTVWSYDSADALFRPTRIFNAQRKSLTGYEIPLNSMSRDDYAQQVNKESAGTPTQYYYDPQINVGVLYLWQPPADSSEYLVLDVDRPVSIMVDASNTYDFPEEWSECIAYGLAVRIAPEYAVSYQDRQDLKKDFNSMVQNLMSYNRDWTSTFFGVETNG